MVMRLCLWNPECLSGIWDTFCVYSAASVPACKNHAKAVLGLVCGIIFLPGAVLFFLFRTVYSGVYGTCLCDFMDQGPEIPGKNAACDYCVIGGVHRVRIPAVLHDAVR